MFENIIGQLRAVDALKNDLKIRSLAPSLLFAGPLWSGKKSCALELARVLNCKEKALWNCECSSCSSQRLLLDPNIIMIGKRPFYEEIASSITFLKKSGSVPSRYMVVRNLRTLMKRFDPILWEGDEAKLKGIRKYVDKINDFLLLITPGSDLPSKDELDAELDDILSIIPAMEKLVPNTIPINQIRKIINWSHRASASSKKIVIIENADKMQESSRNSLLKLLEEPPSDFYLFLLTTRKRMIMPTILSRVRVYNFFQRPQDTEANLISRIFKEDDKLSLKDFFSDFKHDSANRVSGCAEQFIQAVKEGSPHFPEDLFEGFSDSDWSLFYEELLEKIQKIFRAQEKKSPALIARMDVWSKAVKDGVSSIEAYNQNRLMVLRDIYSSMRKK